VGKAGAVHTADKRIANFQVVANMYALGIIIDQNLIPVLRLLVYYRDPIHALKKPFKHIKFLKFKKTVFIGLNRYMYLESRSILCDLEETSQFNWKNHQPGLYIPD
jgi:hypothetical protein